jgi:PAS domain S-box-containing protein
VERFVANDAQVGAARATVGALLLLLSSLAGAAPPAPLVVVSDGNYPPYLFRADGRLQGILVDKWALWSKTTGMPVQVEGLAWAQAQERVLGGGADVIEALAYNEARARLYEFSPSYATVEARVYFHRSISGINDIASMRGFTIGAKEGSACAAWLAERGITAIRGFASSENLVRAAGLGEVRLFCMDSPAAQYFLYKQALADEFRQTAPLYTAGFHWAVAGGRTELRDFIQSGFERIPEARLREIEERWFGAPLGLRLEPRHFYYLAAGAAAALAGTILLVLWNRTLRNRVAARTATLDGHRKVLELIASGALLADTLQALVRFIEAQSPGMLCSILLLDAAGGRMRHGAAPSLPDSYNRAIDGEPIGPRAGSCGTAAWRREQVITEDIATDPLWEDYRGIAARHGLRACWSTPIIDHGGRVLGTFAIYFRETRRPTPGDLELIGMATHTAAIAIVRQREEEALRESEDRLRLAVQAGNIGLWDWDIAGNRLYYSPEWKSQLGYRDDELSSRFEEWRNRLHPEDRERTLPKVRAYLANPRGTYEAEYRLRHRDGSYRWIYARAHVETDAVGTPQRMLGCHIDVTERKRAEEDLQRSFWRLQELSRRLIEVEESERRNINRELHDRVGQNLSALNLSLGMIGASLAQHAPSAVTARLDDARGLLEMTSRQVRDVMAELRPAALDDYGLAAALRHHATAVATRLGIPVTVEGQDLDPRLPPATETALFRIVQEALANIAKHAQASRVKIALTRTARGVRLTVADDGVGFDAAARRARHAASYGIVTMHERAEAVGARLKIVTAPGEGTRVEIEAAADA